MRSRVVFLPTKPWERLAERFRACRIEEGRDLAGLGLTDRERAVVCLFLGLNGIAPHLQHEIAATLKLTKQRVQALLRASLAKIERQRYTVRPE